MFHILVIYLAKNIHLCPVWSISNITCYYTQYNNDKDIDLKWNFEYAKCTWYFTHKGQLWGYLLYVLSRKFTSLHCHCKHIFIMNILINATESTQASKLIEYILPLHDNRFVFNWVWPVSINAKWLYNFNPVGIGWLPVYWLKWNEMEISMVGKWKGEY